MMMFHGYVNIYQRVPPFEDFQARDRGFVAGANENKHLGLCWDSISKCGGFLVDLAFGYVVMFFNRFFFSENDHGVMMR